LAAKEKSLAAAFGGLHSGTEEARDARLHVIQTIHDTEVTSDITDRNLLTARICEPDDLGASYRAGLAAGGEEIDWVAWYLERTATWNDESIAAAKRAQLERSTFRAGLEALPECWE
jgi:hypothetical protein